MSTGTSTLVRAGLGAVAAILVAALAVPGLLGSRPVGQANAAPTASDSGPTKGITVQGTGRVTISPDLATINVSVQSQGSTAAKTQSQASGAMAKVIAAVKSHGVADADMATQWIALSPQYSYSPNGTTPPKVVGYQANQSLSVKVRHIDDSGAIIDAAVGAGANGVDGISFSVSDPTRAAAQARLAAVADAKTRAAALASAAGVTLGSAISITEVSATVPVPIPYALDKAAGAPTTPVQPGTTDIEVDVQVTFAITG